MLCINGRCELRKLCIDVRINFTPVERCFPVFYEVLDIFSKCAIAPLLVSSKLEVLEQPSKTRSRLKIELDVFRDGYSERCDIRRRQTEVGEIN